MPSVTIIHNQLTSNSWLTGIGAIESKRISGYTFVIPESAAEYTLVTPEE